MMNKVPARTRRGRRPGRPETRARVLDVARRRFLAEGYDAVTMRSIAAEAGVDVALVSYFFGSKKGLFGAALALPANPPELLLGALQGDPATLPERVLRALLHAWEDPQQAAPLRVMVTAAVRDPEVARLLKEVFEREMIARIAEHIGGADAHHRAGAFFSQLAGLVFARYVLQVDPLATMTVDELTRHLTPGLRAAMHSPRPAPRAVGSRAAGGPG
jgi:AcrR family transcriptional regulator